MIRALWFMIKVGVLVAAVVWIAERPGFVHLQWLNYEARIHFGFFMLAMLALLLVSIFAYNIIRTFVDFPQSFSRYLELKKHEKGYRALTLGLTAVAAGDTKIAAYQAFRAEKFLEDDAGLPLLLKAQAARLEGKEDEARKTFLRLLENKDAAFLGVRGLLQAALDNGEFSRALTLSRQALAIHPKQPWILRLVYDLEIRQREWAQARKTLQRAEKAGAIEALQAKSDRAAMYLAEAEDDLQNDRRDDALQKLENAHRSDPEFVPAVTRLAKMYVQFGKRRKAEKMVARAWKAAPHPDLAQVWDLLVPVKKSPDPMARLQWFEKLGHLNEKSPEGHMAVAQAAMDEGLWGEARDHLRKAEALHPSAGVYKVLAALEEKSTGNDELALMWLEKAADAAPDKVWVCSETGRIYEDWYPVAMPHGAFNTIAWDYPHIQGTGRFMQQAVSGMNQTLIEAPKA